VGTLARRGSFATTLMDVKPMAVLGISFAAGSIPSSQIAARLKAGADLRTLGTGTVGGTNLYRVAGFMPLALSGIADVAKATVGPLLAGRSRPVLGAVAGGAAIAGHNWSPLLRGAGGRGFAPSLGALGVNAWPGIPLMLGGLLAGKAAKQTGLGGFAAQCALVPLLARTHGRRGALVGACVVVPMWTKRVLGNTKPEAWSPRVALQRLLFDRDEPDDPDGREP
jgi:acyl phosphate:glycerol-3-phosphate acyltransferase